jgi:hypothetical protein
MGSQLPALKVFLRGGFKQAVFGGMAHKLATWLLMDGEQDATAVAQRQLITTSSATLPSISLTHHLSVAASAIGEVLV